MDLGIFLSSKKKMLVWAIGPFMFLSILSLSYIIYFKLLCNCIDEKDASMKLTPLLSEKISSAKAILASYQNASDRTGALEILNSQLNQLAGGRRFSINSLTVERDMQKNPEDSKVAVFKIEIQGAGSLDSIMGFLHDVYALDKLFATENINLRVSNSNDTKHYNANFTLAYYDLQ